MMLHLPHFNILWTVKVLRPWTMPNCSQPDTCGPKVLQTSLMPTSYYVRHHSYHLQLTPLRVCSTARFQQIDWLIGLSSVLRPRQHSIGYMWDGFYGSKDPTNSIEILKEQIVHRQIKHTISRHEHKTQQVPQSTMGWLGDGSHRGQGCQT